MIVTNIAGKFKTGREQRGFYMNGYEVCNLLGIKDYLKDGWDCIGIISGHGEVRIGKSVKAFQIASFCAWLLHGGWIDMELVKIGNKTTWQINKIINPKKPINFNLQENVIFNALELEKQSVALYNKYGKGQVLVYDEGREGLEGARAMENLNKIMADFFQKCGYMGHVIIIVLPNFFKLHEDYAVSRTLFLIDVFTDKNRKRGYFNFYNKKQKEMLYFLGKKRVGISNRYAAASETFWGRFTSWFPFDKKEYDNLKEESIKKKYKHRFEIIWKKQRDAAIYMVRKYSELPLHEIARELSVICQYKLHERSISRAISNITREKEEDV